MPSSGEPVYIVGTALDELPIGIFDSLGKAMDATGITEGWKEQKSDNTWWYSGDLYIVKLFLNSGLVVRQ